jgi:hypothetical protein
MGRDESFSPNQSQFWRGFMPREASGTRQSDLWHALCSNFGCQRFALPQRIATQPPAVMLLFPLRQLRLPPSDRRLTSTVPLHFPREVEPGRVPPSPAGCSILFFFSLCHTFPPAAFPRAAALFLLRTTRAELPGCFRFFVRRNRPAVCGAQGDAPFTAAFPVKL